jgi:hypothetical protein
MKSTIKLTPSKAVCVQPCKQGGVVLEITNKNALHVLATITTIHLTQDQCGALLFAIEQAAEAADMMQMRAAA